MSTGARTALWSGLASAGAVLALRPLLVSGGWLVPALAVVAAVTATGLAVRGLARRTGWAVLAQVLVLLAALLLLFGAPSTVAGVLPTGATPAHFLQLAGEGVQAVQRYSVPAADVAGLRLLLVAGAGVLALSVDLLAVVLRSPAVAGVPLAAVTGVPLALAPGGSSAAALVLVAVPWLVLLVGAGGTAARRPSPARSSAVRTGASVAALALVAAVAVPAAVPALDERPLTVDTGSGDTITVVNPILDLKASLGARSDTTILTYRTDQPDPAPLRIVTADVFDGGTWAPSTGADIPRSQRVQDGLPAAPGLDDAVRERSATRTTSVSVRGLEQTYLPLPYPALRVDVEGDWLYEADNLNVVGDGGTTRGLDYTVTHLEVDPTEEELRAAGPPPADVRERYTALPADLPQSVREEARRVTADAGDDYERAAALQRFFRSTGGFTYSTEAPDDSGSDAVAAFLQQRYGFCVQFSSAMAVMARSLGIPARVAIGFLPGEESGDTWRISARDAHAWPELWFSGVGWVRFEPTPATRTGQSPGWSVPRVEAAVPTTAPTTAPAPTASAPAPSASAPTASASQGAGGTRAVSGWQRVGSLPWGWVAAGAVLLALLLAPRWAADRRGRRRWAEVRRADGTAAGTAAAEAAWTELVERATDLGAGPATGETPRRWAARVGAAHDLPPAALAALERVRAGVETARFAAPAGSAGSGGVLTAARPRAGAAARVDVDTVVTALAAGLPRRRRLRARWLPTAGARAALQRREDRG